MELRQTSLFWQSPQKFSGVVSMENKMKPGGGVVDVLIVAQPSRFREGLKTIIQALTWVGKVNTLEHWTAVSNYVLRYHPAFVIFDMSDLDTITWVEAGTLRKSCRKTKCIAVIDRAQQRSKAQAMEADAILLRGFSTDLLYDTMRTLIVAYDPAVPVTGPLGQLRP
jgi:DNA-binding NarL/FixJ family response regulator